MNFLSISLSNWPKQQQQLWFNIRSQDSQLSSIQSNSDLENITKVGAFLWLRTDFVRTPLFCELGHFSFVCIPISDIQINWKNCVSISFSKVRMTKSGKGRMLEVKISSSKVLTEYLFCLSIKWPYKMEDYSVMFQCTFLDRLEGMFMFSKLNDLCWSVIKTKTKTKPNPD